MEERYIKGISFLKATPHGNIHDEFPTITKPTIIILGGNPTISKKEADRNIKIVSSILGESFSSVRRDKFDIYSSYYNKGTLLDNNYEMSYRYNDADFCDFAEFMFMPLLYNESGTKKLPLAEAKKNLRKVIVFAHSAGVQVMNKTMEMFDRLLIINEYSKKDRHELLNQISFMAYSPFGIVEGPVSAIYITPINDSLNSWFRPIILKEKIENWQFDYDRIQQTKEELAKELETQDYISYIGENDGVKFLNITPRPLRNDYKEDHGFLGLLRKPNGDYPYSSETGVIVSEIMQYLIKSTLEKGPNEKAKSTNDENLEIFQEALSQMLVNLSQSKHWKNDDNYHRDQFALMLSDEIKLAKQNKQKNNQNAQGGILV